MTLGAAKEFKYIQNKTEIKANVEIFAMAKLTNSVASNDLFSNDQIYVLVKTTFSRTTGCKLWLRLPFCERYKLRLYDLLANDKINMHC